MHMHMDVYSQLLPILPCPIQLCVIVTSPEKTSNCNYNIKTGSSQYEADSQRSPVYTTYITNNYICISQLYTQANYNHQENTITKNHTITKYSHKIKTSTKTKIIKIKRYHTVVQIFKLLHQISPPYLHNIFQLSRDVTGHVSWNLNHLIVPKMFTILARAVSFY